MKKILLVDDDVSMLNVVKLLLAYNNYRVKAISKWQVITETIQMFAPDIIMLDIDLGGADGSEICKKLKQSKKTKDVPVILISAYNISGSYVKGCNAQGFIGKPFEIATVLETIKSNLDYNLN